eukprot:COSAG02_NODE_6229_length_3711_cov_49.018549_3_plen_83_part_00
MQVVLKTEQEGTSSPVFKTTASMLGVTVSAEASRKKLSEAKVFETLHTRLSETPSSALDVGAAGKSRTLVATVCSWGYFSAA